MGISPDDKKKIIKQYPKSSISELSRELGVSRRAIKKVLEEKEQQRSRMKKRAALLSLILVLAIGAAAGTAYYVKTLPPPAAGPEDRNLLIVTVDTCRADHLGCYGYENASTPLIDSIAVQGVKMERAYAIQPITLPSHATIFTGLHPRKHGVHDNGVYQLSKDALTLAEVLKKKGYLTAAITSAFVLNSQFGLSQGFEYYDDRLDDESARDSGISEIQASIVSDRATTWIEKNANKKWFLWLHYFDPHTKYEPPPRFERATGSPYDGEIAYVDHELERVMDLLERKNLRRKTVVIITSDHGESLGEHGEGSHGIFLYDCTMHVPMIFSLPGALPQGKSFSKIVSLMDLMPTALDLLGLKAPPPVQGRSFKPLLTGGADHLESTPVAMETMLPWEQFGWSPNLALRKNGYKYIEAPQPELYNLEEDPDELTNIYDRNKGRARAMARELQKMLKQYGQNPLTGQSKRKMDSDDRRQLASLGYLMSGDGSEPDQEAPDAKEMLEVKKQYEKALQLRNQGKQRQAIEMLKKVVQKNPGNNKATVSLAEWLRLEGKPQQARQYLEKVIQRQPNHVEAYIKQALVFVDLEELDKAEESLQKALELGVKKHKSYRIMGIVYLKKKDYQKSLHYSRKAIEIFPAYHQAFVGVAAAYQEMGDYDKALQSLNKANRLHPNNQKYKMFIKALKRKMRADKAQDEK